MRKQNERGTWSDEVRKRRRDADQRRPDTPLIPSCCQTRAKEARPKERSEVGKRRIGEFGSRKATRLTAICASVKGHSKLLDPSKVGEMLI